jgi:hypothetical protein
LGGDDGLRSRGQPAAPAAKTKTPSAPHASFRFQDLLATPRTV